MSDIPQDIAAMSFEDALAELEAIVQRIEKGDETLDESIKAYERGAHLKSHCEAKLAEAKAKVDRITLSGNGKVGTQPADIG